MSETKNTFAGLIKISTDSYSVYEEQKHLGKLIFADVSTGEKAGKYIYANGIEYNILDASAFYKIMEDVENVTSTAFVQMAETLGLNSSFGVSWSPSTGFPEGLTYKEAIETLVADTSTIISNGISWVFV